MPDTDPQRQPNSEQNLFTTVLLIMLILVPLLGWWSWNSYTHASERITDMEEDMAAFIDNCAICQSMITVSELDKLITQADETSNKEADDETELESSTGDDLESDTESTSLDSDVSTQDDSHLHSLVTLPWNTTYLGNTIDKNELGIGGTLGFLWGDSELSDTITLGASSNVNWISLWNFPLGCGANQAVQTIGDTLTCVDLSAGSGLWDDGGNTTYLTSITDDLAIGGIDATAPFFFDTVLELLKLKNIQVGGTSDYISISDTGFLQLHGNATVWDDLKIPVTSTKVGGSKDPDFVKVKDDGGGSQGVFTYHFDQGTEEELYFTLQIPHNWKQQSSIKPHVHWMPTDGGGGNVVWGLEYTWQNYDSAFGNTTIISGTGTTDSTAFKHHITGLGTIDGTGYTHSSMLICRIYRKAADASDTYGSDAALLEVDFHYEIDQLGTDTEIPPGIP